MGTAALQDPYLDTNRCVRRLLAQYLKHGALVVAVDWDDTLFDFHKTGATYPQVTGLLKACNKLGFRIVIYTCSPKSRYREIKAECKRLGIQIEGVNKHLVDLGYGPEAKLYCNILLDDKAGLDGVAVTHLDALDASTRWTACHRYKDGPIQRLGTQDLDARTHQSVRLERLSQAAGDLSLHGHRSDSVLPLIAETLKVPVALASHGPSHDFVTFPRSSPLTSRPTITKMMAVGAG